MSDQDVGNDRDRSVSPEKKSGAGKRYSVDRRGNRSREKPMVEELEQASGNAKTQESSKESGTSDSGGKGKTDAEKTASDSGGEKNEKNSEASSKNQKPSDKPPAASEQKSVTESDAEKAKSCKASAGGGDKKGERGSGSGGKYGETRWGPRQVLRKDEKPPTGKGDASPAKERDADKSKPVKNSGGGEERKTKRNAANEDKDDGGLAEREKKALNVNNNARTNSRDERRGERQRSGKSGGEDSGAKGGRQEASARKTSARDDKSRKSIAEDSKEKRHAKDSKSEPKLSRAELEAKRQEEDRKKKEMAEKRKQEEQAKKEAEERRREEEKIRREEEAKQAEEERKKQEEEEAKRLLEEEKNFIHDYAIECRERVDSRKVLGQSNLAAKDNRPDDAFFFKLDSSLKKNTAFVKKLKNLSEPQKDALTKDFNSLNLTKYIGECASAIVEAKLKMSDINCAVHICSLIHQRYAEFAPTLLEEWLKTLPSKKDEKILNPSKLRVDLRLFAELVVVGLFRPKEGLGILANQLSMLMVSDKDEHNNLPIVLSFCKHCGDDYAGLLSRKSKQLAEKYNVEIVRSVFLPPERQKACRNLLADYYVTLTKHLLRSHKELKAVEKHNRRLLHTKGELNAERREQYETLSNAFHKLLNSTQTFSDILDEEMPELPEDDNKGDFDDMGFDIFNPLKNSELQYEGDATLFEDEETRVFYENLPDLKVIVPAILYKDSAGPAPNVDENGLEQGMDDLKIEDVEKEMEEAELGSKVNAEEGGEEENNEDAEEEEDEVEEEEGESNTKILLENFITTLPNCVNREMIDKAAIEFCMKLNTKANRHKLVRALFKVQRTRYDLLPFYSRLTATLYPVMTDIANDLVYQLKNDMRWHMKKKDQINIESKIKTVRFIGELVKFKMFPKSEALNILKTLLFDFKHHNIEMVCAFLDVAGRFLFRSPESHLRTKIYVEIMMRKKATLHLDVRYVTMIENAYYYSNPPDVPYFAKKERPPMHEYIRKLLFKDLAKTNVEKILRQIRKLDWDNNEVAAYCTKCLISVWNMRYNNIHCAANLLAGLAIYYNKAAIQVVDAILEDIRLGMEINLSKFNQRRVSEVKFLGELYNYRMVESSVIFKILYSFITFGVSLDEDNPSPLDPPEHLFRIRLCCVILDTCGQYFDRGSSKKKLDYFLLYFQRYYLFKRKHPLYTVDRPFPIIIDNLIDDMLDEVRPDFELAESYELACALVLSLEKAFRQKLAGILPITETDDHNDSDVGLHTIHETDEDLSLSQINDDNDGTVESEDERDRRSNSQQPKVSDQEDEEESNVESDVIESAGEEELEDSVVILKAGPRVIDCEEDKDFIGEFDKMLSDNIHARSQESVKVPSLDIAVPMHLRGSALSKQPPGSVPIPGIFSPSVPAVPKPPSPVPQGKGAIKFVLMTRKGNKQHFSDLNVPISAEFAAKFREREEAEQAEKAKMKRVVLDMHERQEEEDYQEMMSCLERPVQQPVYNRERRINYKHPKGAPDADAIFGSGYKGKR